MTINLIKKKRHEKCMFQQTLAEKMGVSKKTIYRWERYESYPSVMQMNRLEEVLDLNIVDLMTNMIEIRKERSIKEKELED